MPGVFQPQVQSHLLQTWFLHTGLEQLPTVYGCYKGHNLTAPEWEKKSRCTESDQGQPTVQYLLSKPTAKRHTKPVSTSGSRSGKYVAGQTHSCNLTEAMTKAKGLGLNTAPEWKGNPDETSHSSFHCSLTQGYMAAPYLRWPWALAAEWTAGGWGTWGPDTTYPTNTYCSSLLVTAHIPVTATAVKILIPLLHSHKLTATFFLKTASFFKLWCFGKALSSPDNKAVGSSREQKEAEQPPSPSRARSDFLCKQYSTWSRYRKYFRINLKSKTAIFVFKEALMVSSTRLHKFFF